MRKWRRVCWNWMDRREVRNMYKDRFGIEFEALSGEREKETEREIDRRM